MSFSREKLWSNRWVVTHHSNFIINLMSKKLVHDSVYPKENDLFVNVKKSISKVKHSNINEFSFRWNFVLIDCTSLGLQIDSVSWNQTFSINFPISKHYINIFETFRSTAPKYQSSALFNYTRRGQPAFIWGNECVIWWKLPGCRDKNPIKFFFRVTLSLETCMEIFRWKHRNLMRK